MGTTTRAAVLWGYGEDWKIEDVELDDPKANDVLVSIKAAGLCHSDDHAHTGDLPLPVPLIGGHEGAGVVEAVGPDVRDLAPGDHVAVSFIPACGKCRWCSTGRQYLCDSGAKLFDIGMMSDGRVAHHVTRADGSREPVGRYAQAGTFSEKILVNEDSLVKVDPDLPFDVVALTSCGVATGFGSATERAGTVPGDNVVVVGIGGIGINAVQGAKIAGAQRVIAVDPVEMKREQAMAFGATHTYASMEEAAEAVRDMTEGIMAERVILAPGVVHGDMIQPAMDLTAKGGTLVVTGLAPAMESDVQLNLMMLSMSNKEIKGTIFGSQNPRDQIPRLLSMYRQGVLRLDELVTRRYTLDEVNQGYEDMLAGRNIRGVIEF
ncbi:NDMA-dependent alcohol dehydrogenase [Rhabdothermincola salaria]|uniref:NDMA-dependent alcohol dehydrogenase n=1 Tax=Rhabdothermincola salaria TaxID=2903142 RepID=UPI001E4B6357|nr:NDMA-dependent alcohol dehydrogenase [Rhabdothermincola salaria]MCD9624285.1 NDMA-dependent alcohol dehydrogenase [Rhabdothermincola salaria]